LRNTLCSTRIWLQTPKRFGGLGIREARLTNLALLGKLVWNMLHNKDKLWVKVLSHKYMGNTSLWMNKKHNKSPITWRGIQHAITNFAAGYSFRVGSGDSSIWNIDWTQLGPLCQLVSFVNIGDSVMCLKDVWGDGRWNLQGLATMIPTDIVQYIHQLPAPNNLDVRLPDAWTWRHAKKGEYTCLSGYYWLLQQNRNWNVNCSSPMEDILHCLRDCPHSRELWLRLNMGCCNNFSLNLMSKFGFMR